MHAAQMTSSTFEALQTGLFPFLKIIADLCKTLARLLKMKWYDEYVNSVTNAI